MQELLGEIAFRSAKVLLAVGLGLVIVRLVAGSGPVTPELGLLGFLAGAAVILLMERSPF